MLFVIRCPIHVYRQIYRHQRASHFGFQFIYDKFYIPRKWRIQTDQRYVFEEFNDGENNYYTTLYTQWVENRLDRFRQLTSQGIDYFKAKLFLNYGFYVQTFRKSDGIELFNFLNLRCDYHSQWETRQFALKIAEIFAQHFPLTFRVWYEEYWNKRGDERNKVVDDIYKKTCQA